MPRKTEIARKTVSRGLEVDLSFRRGNPREIHILSI